MAKILDTTTGQVAEVPDELAGQAKESGRFVDVTAGRVQVRDRNGLRGDIDAAELEQARASGFQVLTGADLDEERLDTEYGDRPVAAGAAGLLRGATLGLSDLALTATGAVDKEALRELRKRNEGASTVTEIGGAMLPLVFSGGSAAPAAGASRLATAVGTRVAGEGGRALVREGVAGFVEGGLQGLGELVTEQAIEKDPKLTGQKVLATVGGGALLGMLGGAGFGGVEDVRAARKLLGDAAEDATETVAERAAAESGKAAVGEVEEAAADAVAGGAGDAAQAATPEPVRRKAGVYEVPLDELADIPTTLDGKAGAADRVRELYEKKGLSSTAIDPIKIGTDVTDPDNLTRTMTDGNHRLAVARERGEKTIRVEFSDDDAASVFFNRRRAEGQYPGATAPMDDPAWRRPLSDKPGAPPAAAAPDGAAPPPPPGAQAAAYAQPLNPLGSPDAFDSAVSGVGKAAENFRKEAEKAVQEKAPLLKRIWEALDLGPLTPEEMVVRDFDLKKKGLQRMREKGGLEDKAARYLLEDSRYAQAKTAEQKMALVESMVEESGSAVGEAVKRFDTLATEAERFSPADFINRARKDLVAPLARGTVDERRTARRLEQELRALAEGTRVGRNVTTGETILGKLGFSEVEAFKRRLDKSLKWDASTPNMVRDELRKLRGMLNADQEARVLALGKRTGEDTITAWKAAKEKYGAMVEWRNAAAGRLEDAKKANRVFSLSDNLVGTASMMAGGLANPASWPLALGGALLNKWGRERLPHVMALALYRMERNPAEGMAARAFRRVVLEGEDEAGSAGARAARGAGGDAPGGPGAAGMPDGGPRAAAGAAGGDAASTAAVAGGAVPAAGAGEGGRFGRYTDILRHAARLGPEALWSIHTAMAGDEEYRASLEQAGIKSGPDSDGRAAKRAAHLGRVQQAMEAADARVDGAVGALVSGKRPALRPADLKRAREQAEHVATLAQNPEQLIGQLSKRTAALSEAAPDASLSMVTTMQQAVAYLAGKAPRAPAPAVDVPLLRPGWKPTDLELQRFAGHVSGALNPLGVLEDMAAGRVQREQVEAMRTVYPELFEDVKARIIARLSEAGSTGDYQRRISYSQRLALGSVLGVPVEPSARPDRVAAAQSIYAQQPTRPTPRRVGGAPPRSLAGGFTESERLDNRSA